MKTLKSGKRPALARSRRTASGGDPAIGRERISSRSGTRSGHRDAARSAFAGRAKEGRKERVPPIPKRPQVDVQYQTAVKNFETGVRAFQKQNYDRAAEIFEKLVQSDARDVAERAHVHLRLCRQRTGRPTALPKSAEDYYTLGIACLNAREFERAVEHLTKADRMKPHQDHIHYALAVSHCLTGNSDDAMAHLEAAIALRPENRIHARRDEDLQGLSADPRFRRLIYLAGS